jgi:hypothetical protein
MTGPLEVKDTKTATISNGINRQINAIAARIRSNTLFMIVLRHE